MRRDYRVELEVRNVMKLRGGAQPCEYTKKIHIVHSTRMDLAKPQGIGYNSIYLEYGGRRMTSSRFA